MTMFPHHYLTALFCPTSVAVVGAGTRPGSLGAAVYRNLRDGGFQGPLLPVNPRHAEIDGAPCHKSLLALPHPVDLAVIATPAAAVPGVLEDAARARIGHALILTAGFGETGAAGRALEDQVRSIARRAGIRLVGPNCLGMMRPSIGLNASFARVGARPGHLALIAQSGAVCAALTDWAHAAGIGFSSVVSTGAAADLDFGEILDFLLYDEATAAILLYIEGIRDARRFIGALRALARAKPVMIFKAGRRAAGSRAAHSHTGALTGDDQVFDAVLSRCGVVRAGTYAELFAAARVMASGRLPTGNRLAVLTNGGGPGVIAADCAAALAVELAPFAPQTLDTLDQVLPKHWSHGNPADIIGDATAERFAHALAPILADPAVDGVLTLFCPQIMSSAEDVAAALLAGAKTTTKPVLTSWLGGASVDAGRNAIESAGMPAFDSPEAGVTCFAALARYRRAQALMLEAPPSLAPGASPDIAGSHALARAVAASGRTLMSEPESKRLLANFGIPTPETVVAKTLVEAIATGKRLGFPLALKIVSPDIAHKSDVEGVVLSVRDLPELEREFRNLEARVARRAPQARIEGVAIQRMVEKRFGREVIVGVARDAVFGQVITFGAGGVAVEVLRDSAVGLPPLNDPLARDLIERTRIARQLATYRHIPAANLDALIQVLLSVSDMVCALPWIAEMDINPLSVDAAGVIALDARVVIDPARLDPDPRYPHLAIHPYPAHLEEHATLGSGALVSLRPVRPEDAVIEREFVEALSENSRYMRFFNPARTISPRLLARLTQLDYERELALLAFHDNAMIGVARYSPNLDGTSCEFAVTVADAWHGKGVATLLMQRLMAAARAAGYARMTGTVLANNYPMHALMAGLGFAAEPVADDPSLLEFAINL
ncbi:MAG: bifunctional acetate--CoA ligase family protein/GNAT family N-acetyltransferase [Burkholderiales bacterium]|nr:bifunctional acetate--CoA ligase family protein/GNAT family N-acetyltransferase [Burkholderiales bacterium]